MTPLSQSEEALFDEIEKNPPLPVSLQKVRQVAVKLRDAQNEKQDLEARLSTINAKIGDIERRELPDLFANARISSITVEADGNHPAFIAERSTGYAAKIPEDRKFEAFRWFEDNGHGDLVKALIVVQFGMYELEARRKLCDLLAEKGVDFCTTESVHPMTLKAFVKHEIQQNHPIPMDLLGASMWDQVKIK
jgi:hypothetical protein